MYCAGWVHRDISSGNILAHRTTSGTWQAKLSDLEYAKRYPPPLDYHSAVDPKTVCPPSVRPVINSTVFAGDPLLHASRNPQLGYPLFF
jgi:serine/threonine protein kinase